MGILSGLALPERGRSRTVRYQGVPGAHPQATVHFD